MRSPLLSNAARGLLERALGERVSVEGAGASQAMFRRSLLYLGRTAPELVRAVAAIPEDRAPWEWCPEQAEESRAPMLFPGKAVLELAGRLSSDAGVWMIQPEDLVIAFLALAGAPLMPAAAWRVKTVTEDLQEGNGGAAGIREATENSLEQALAALSAPEEDEPRRGKAEEEEAAGAVGTARAAAAAPECPTLESLAVDLTRDAAAGKLPPVVGRDAEVTAVLETLLRLSKRNPLLVGPPGCGKTAVAAGVAQRIAAGGVPVALAGARLMALSAGDLVAGMKYVGALEERMTQVIEEASQPGVLLFIDEIHLAVGAGTSSKDDQDVANLLKPALADGRIACIGATTDVEVGRLAKDPAFERRFRTVPVEELGREAALTALRSRAAFIQERTGVEVRDRAVVLAANLADRLVRHRVRPDKGIDVLEQAVARAQMRGMSSVNGELVREVVREMIGMPFRAAELAGRLRVMREVVEGLGLVDGETADRLANRLQMTMLGMDVRPERPNAVVLALGPRESGEELARILSEVLLESEEVVRIDLPEGRGPAAERTLLGPEGGRWKEAAPAFHLQLARRPWSVVLVTGAEKAGPEAVDILAGAMERGVLETAAGRRVPFADSVFVIVAPGERARAPGFSTAGDEAAAAAAAGKADAESALKRLGPRLARQVDVACAVTGGAAAPGERWVRLRLLGPVSRRWETETGVEVSFDAAVAAALAEAAGKGKRDLSRVTRIFEERVAAPLAPALAGASSGERISVRLVSAAPLEVVFSVSRRARTDEPELPSA